MSRPCSAPDGEVPSGIIANNHQLALRSARTSSVLFIELRPWIRRSAARFRSSVTFRSSRSRFGLPVAREVGDFARPSSRRWLFTVRVTDHLAFRTILGHTTVLTTLLDVLVLPLVLVAPCFQAWLLQ